MEEEGQTWAISVWIIEHKKNETLHLEDRAEKSSTVAVWLHNDMSSLRVLKYVGTVVNYTEKT